MARDENSPTSNRRATVVACAGRPRFHDEALGRLCADVGASAAWVEAYDRHGVEAPCHVSGDFAVALREPGGRTFLAVDRFSIRTLCYRVEGDLLHVSDRATTLADGNATLDSQALFDYLYFHMIPAPRTIFPDVRRLPAGHYGVFDGSEVKVAPWWKPRFDERRHGSLDQLKEEFRQLLRECVADQVDGSSVGCFLSGGTDSSTVAGLLRDVTGRPARAFSIGFEAEGYDEMAYARAAARHFGAEHHEYYVTPDDLVRCIPHVAAWYDQPFGNSSVLPAYYCAKAAHDEGITLMLGGDGGDELFGGNTRYAKQRVFAVYEAIPAVVRRALVEPVFCGTSVAKRIPLLRKVASYVDQARVPMPDRMQTYNLLMRLGLRDVLTPEFLANVDAQDPVQQQRQVYGACSGHALVNRMLEFDWRYTLADNDLPKVVGATDLAGVGVGFPLLDDRLVDFSLRLLPELKLKGLKLRWFFKEALRGYLPEEIIAKKKHGFGLPFGVWALRHPGLNALALGALESLKSRGIVRAEFIDRLSREYLPLAPGYYGEMVWILMMLEQWLSTHSSSASGPAGPR